MKRVNSAFDSSLSKPLPMNSPRKRRARPSVAFFSSSKSESSCAFWSTFRKFTALTPNAAPRNSSAVAGRSREFLNPTFTSAATEKDFALCRRTWTAVQPGSAAAVISTENWPATSAARPTRPMTLRLHFSDSASPPIEKDFVPDSAKPADASAPSFR